MRSLFLLPATLVGALVLSGCTDPSTVGDGQNRTRDGALLGGAIGAVTGIIAGDDAESRRRGAAIGGVLGAGVGAAIGNQLDKQAAELEQNLQGDGVRIVNTGEQLIVTMPQDILFAVDSAEVQPVLRSDLLVLAQSLNDYPNTTVDIIGHTDNTGDASYNQQLSARRAQSVASILVSGGVSSARLRAFGRGEDQPIASNLTPEGQAQNRRVEIVIRPNS
ncbi:MAG: OmpA family protein [Pseudomonadota bacterium]